MERTFRDDLKVVLGVLAGITLGWVVFNGAQDASILVGPLIASALLICVFAILRRIQRRSG